VKRSRDPIIVRLDLNEHEFANALSGVSPDQARFRPAEDQWTILEWAEHVVTTERLMSHVMAAASELASPRVRPEFEFSIEDPSHYRKRPVLSSVNWRPEGKFLFPGEALDRFYEARDATRQYARVLTEDELRSRSIYHPVAGEISCYECLLALMANAAFGAGEIREIRRVHARSRA